MLSEEGKTAVNNALLKKNFQDYTAYKNEFMVQTMLNAIRYPSVGGVEYVSSVITEANAKACGLSADKYLASSKKSEVNAKVARKSYDTISALASAIVPQSDGGGKGNSSPGG